MPVCGQALLTRTFVLHLHASEVQSLTQVHHLCLSHIMVADRFACVNVQSQKSTWEMLRCPTSPQGSQGRRYQTSNSRHTHASAADAFPHLQGISTFRGDRALHFWPYLINVDGCKNALNTRHTSHTRTTNVVGHACSHAPRTCIHSNLQQEMKQSDHKHKSADVKGTYFYKSSTSIRRPVS